MARSTCWRVDVATPGCPVETRDTVCDETPASRATSAIETPPARRAASVIGARRPWGRRHPGADPAIVDGGGGNSDNRSSTGTPAAHQGEMPDTSNRILGSASDDHFAGRILFQLGRAR